jgi:hypothetical protein
LPDTRNVQGSPERLVFEGPPTLGAGLEQDATIRAAKATDGAALDTAIARPELTIGQASMIEAKIARASAALVREAEAVRQAWRERKALEIATRKNLPLAVVRAQLEHSFGGQLQPSFPLYFDYLGEVSVGEVLADPERYIGATLSDPREPETQGPQKAKLLRGERDGALFIKSFAHGGQYFYLVHNYLSLGILISKTPADQVYTVLTQAFPSA